MGTGGATGGGTGGAPNGSDAAPPEDAAADASLADQQEQACRDAIIAQCQRLATCYGEDPGFCAQYADRCPSYYFNPRSLRTVENVEACLPTLKQATCTDISMGLGSPCLAHGTGAAGAPCSGASECQSGSCSGLAPVCGTCDPLAATGAPCGGDAGYCGMGEICHPTSRTCVPAPVTVAHAAAGEACDPAADPPIGCQGDLRCVPAASGMTAGTCTPLPGDGQPCASGVPQCASGLKCGILAPRTGTPVCGNPPACGDTTCSPDETCFESSGLLPACQPDATLGEACVATPGDAYKPCTPDAVCAAQRDVSDGDGGTISQGTCAAYQVLDAACGATAPCRSPFVCQDGRCARFDPETCLSPADAGTD